jgi:Na+-driven multidrug efflux pump
MAGWVLVTLSYGLVIGFALAWAVAFAAVAYTVAYAILMAILWLYERRPIRRWLKRESTPVQEELLD